MRSFTDVHSYDDDDDLEADIGKYLSFCVVTLKTVILIAEGIFDHSVNNCMFSEILESRSQLWKKLQAKYTTKIL